jgi:hypothetical protein
MADCITVCRKIYEMWVLRDVAFQKTANMSNVALAGHLGVNEKVIRRLLDLDHVSKIDRLESALAYFGQQLELSVTTLNHINQLDTLIMHQ